MDTQKNNQYYQEHYPDVIPSMVVQTEQIVEAVGGILSEDGTSISNHDEVTNALLNNKKLAKKLNAVWHNVTKPDGTGSILGHELLSWESIYKDDLIKDVFQRALELARGQITFDAQQDNSKTFFIQ